jgi:hypothetical protein
LFGYYTWGGGRIHEDLAGKPEGKSNLEELGVDGMIVKKR